MEVGRCPLNLAEILGFFEGSLRRLSLQDLHPFLCFSCPNLHKPLITFWFENEEGRTVEANNPPSNSFFSLPRLRILPDIGIALSQTIRFLETFLTDHSKITKFVVGFVKAVARCNPCRLLGTKQARFCSTRKKSQDWILHAHSYPGSRDLRTGGGV